MQNNKLKQSFLSYTEFVKSKFLALNIDQKTSPKIAVIPNTKLFLRFHAEEL